MREFEVEIDGAVFTVKQIMPEEDTGEYGEEEAALIARACLLVEEETEKKAYSPEMKREKTHFHETSTEKVKEIFREKVTEKFVQGQLETLRKNQIPASEPSVNYRRQIEELSRYLSRDSRRYDGYFEIY